ncbi:MAG: protein-disulfide reductase DsbD domain-containing protein [Bacteroidia bacterium]
MRNVFFILAVLLQLVAFGQSGDKTTKWTEAHELGSKKWKKGTVVTLKFTADIQKGYHIYAANQPSKAVLPLKIQYAKGTDVTAGNIEEKGGYSKMYDEIFKAEIAQFEGKMEVTQKVTIKNPKKDIVGTLKYQICTDEMCLPASYDFVIPAKKK